MFQQTFCFCFGTFATCHCFPNKAAAQTEDRGGRKLTDQFRCQRKCGRKNNCLRSHVEKSEDSSADRFEESEVPWKAAVNQYFR